MSIVVANTYKELGKGFTGEEKYMKCTYDFSEDAGAFADIIQLGQFEAKSIVTKALVHVETACTSAGSATVAIGTTTDADGFLDATSGAVASLTGDAVIYETTMYHYAAADDYILFDIATADLTAGKVNVHIWYVNAD